MIISSQHVGSTKLYVLEVSTTQHSQLIFIRNTVC